MIKIERKETEKTKQAIADLQKASEIEGDYNTESVNQALKEIFHGKCYICENKAANAALSLSSFFRRYPISSFSSLSSVS